MPTDAETHGANFSCGNFRVFRQPIEAGPAVGIEMRNGCFLAVFKATRAAGVVERNCRTGRLDAAVDFGSGGDKPISGEADARAQHRRGELKDVRVTPDASKLAVGLGCGDKGAHGIAGERNVYVFSSDNHESFAVIVADGRTAVNMFVANAP